MTAKKEVDEFFKQRVIIGTCGVSISLEELYLNFAQRYTGELRRTFFPEKGEINETT